MKWQVGLIAHNKQSTWGFSVPQLALGGQDNDVSLAVVQDYRLLLSSSIKPTMWCWALTPSFFFPWHIWFCVIHLQEKDLRRRSVFLHRFCVSVLALAPQSLDGISSNSLYVYTAITNSSYKNRNHFAFYNLVAHITLWCSSDISHIKPEIIMVTFSPRDE